MQKRLVRTYHLHHSRVDTSQRSPLSWKLRPCFICLSFVEVSRVSVDVGGCAAYCSTSSVILCELSIRPRSDKSESAADDLYALWKSQNQISDIWRNARTLCHSVRRWEGSLGQAHVWRWSIMAAWVRSISLSFKVCTFVRLSSRMLSWCSSLCLWIARSIEGDMRSGVLARVASCSLISSSCNKHESTDRVRDFNW